MTLPEFMNDFYRTMKNHFANQILQIINDNPKDSHEELFNKIVKWRDQD